jgi:aminoglycoside 6'-N-acetyltransferase I
MESKYMTSARVRAAQPADRDELAKMRRLLWPNAAAEEQLKELDDALRNGMPGTLPGVILVSQCEGGALLGFLEVGLRSHADGCDPTRPVGYVEGWFVQEAFRDQGVGKGLMRAAEDWAECARRIGFRSGRPLRAFPEETVSLGGWFPAI